MPPLATTNARGSPLATRCITTTSASETDTPIPSPVVPAPLRTTSARVNHDISLDQPQIDLRNHPIQLSIPCTRVEQPRHRELDRPYVRKRERVFQLARCHLDVGADQHEPMPL